MLLRGLAEAPDLRLRVLVGEDALDRPVDGVFTTDLLDPRRYLTGGEIVLTGLMWRRAPADSESFVAALAAAGAVALAAGDAALGSVPDDLVVACRRHGLPLFEVPVDVSFAAITEQVLAARLGLSAGPAPAVARLRALAAGLGRADRGPGTGAAAGLAEVFAVAGREYGAPGWVLSAAGRLVAGAPAAPGGRARSALAGAWLRAGPLPVTVLADGVPYSLFGVTGEPAHRLAGWFVAMAGDQAGWDTGRRAIAAELAAAAAAYRARHEVAQRAVRDAADAVIGRLADRPAGATAPEDRKIAAALRRCGLAPCGPLTAVAVTAGLVQPGAGPSPGTGALTGGDAQPWAGSPGAVPLTAGLVQPGAGPSPGTGAPAGGDAQPWAGSSGAVPLTAGLVQPGAGPSPGTGAPAGGDAQPWAGSPGAVPLPGEMWPPGGARSPVAGADPQGAWAQVARVLLEEMLPGSVAGVHGGAAVALAPGGSATLDRIWDVVRELAAVYGPAAPRDVAPGQFPGGRPAGYSGAPGDVAPGHSAGEAPHGHVAPGHSAGEAPHGHVAPGRFPSGYAGDAVPGGYGGDLAGPAAAVPAPGSLCLAFGVSVLPGEAAPHGPQAGDGLVDPGSGAGRPDAGGAVAGLCRALAQARQAREVAVLLGSGVRLVDAAGLGSVELLLATAPALARRAFRASLLTPLLDYDADHGTELVRTLRVFLDCSGSWTKAAEAMFVHVNSLRYRMRRVEELTGLDLGSLADQAALLLALRLPIREC